MTKARYEFFLFLKASRLRYPARMSTNPMPTPPPKEAVLPFFIYPTTPPTIRTSPYGIVKQKSCIFFQLGFLGKILRSPGKFELNESLFFFLSVFHRSKQKSSGLYSVLVAFGLFCGAWNSLLFHDIGRGTTSYFVILAWRTQAQRNQPIIVRAWCLFFSQMILLSFDTRFLNPDNISQDRNFFFGNYKQFRKEEKKKEREREIIHVHYN